ncbi:MAG: hypothetical protein WDM76_01770 [Limisphaerales bacterium]
MKPRVNSFAIQTACLLSVIAMSVLPLAAAPGISTGTTQSIFLQPTKPSEGCDPFFPKSSRVYAANIAASAKSPELSALVIKGINISALESL